MLRLLLYKKIDEEVKYACTEMLDQIGVPYREIENLRVLKGQNDASYVLILPESSELKVEEAKAVRKSSYSVILTGHVPYELRDDVRCNVVDVKGADPPGISGVITVSGMDAVPFFFEYPVLEFRGNTFQKIGEIEAEHKVQMGVILVEHDSRSFAIIAPQIFRSVTYLLAGSEATLPQQTSESLGLLDEYGRIDGRKTEICRRGFLHTPTVNVYQTLLLRILEEISNRRKTPLVHKWVLPRNHNLAFCLTHDMEHVTSPLVGAEAIVSFGSGRPIEGLARSILALAAVVSAVFSRLHVFEPKDSLRLLPKSMVPKLMRYNPVWNFDKYIETERQFGATSSFYFLVNSTDEDSDYDFQNPLIKEAMEFIKKSGCEAGLHASFYSYNDAGKIEKEKALLEKVSRKKIVGVTQHYMRMVIPDTWKDQESSGLVYDATFGYAQDVGFRAGTCLPFRPWDFVNKRRISILEIPLVIMDGTFFQKQYLRLPPEKAFQMCKELVDVVHRYHGVLTLSWHPYTMLIDRKRNWSWLNFYKDILIYSLRYNPWYTSGKRLAEWWNLRRRVSFTDISWYRSKLNFCINSPKNYNGFSLRIYVPQDSRNVKLFVNNEKLAKKNIVKKGKFLLFSFNLLKGKNEVRVY